MLIPGYTAALQQIQTELSRFSHVSTFNCALNYLQVPKGEAPISRRPWVVLFMLKHAVLQPGGGLVMQERDFGVIANKIWKLQDCLVRDNDPSIILMLRSMIAQQMAYQQSFENKFRSLLLQMELLEISSERNNLIFQKQTGVDIRDYFFLCNYFYGLLHEKSGSAVYKYNLASLYLHFAPSISNQKIILLLKLVATPFKDIPGFMERYRVLDYNSAEYFQESPFLYKPIFLELDGLTVYNVDLLLSGLKVIGFDKLKQSNGFYSDFGRDVELYIHELLSSVPVQLYSVDDLAKYIPVKAGKISDFVIRDRNDVFVVESKAVVPNSLMKCAYEPALLEKILKDSFLKGIEQGQETADKLSRTKEFGGSRIRIFIVTLDEFFIRGGDWVVQHFGAGLVRKLEQQYGELPVPMADISYITLRDLIDLSYWLRDKPSGELSQFIEMIEARQTVAAESRMIMAQHIDEIRGDVSGVAGIEDQADQATSMMESLISENVGYWKKRGAQGFIREFQRFQRLLAKDLSAAPWT